MVAIVGKPNLCDIQIMQIQSQMEGPQEAGGRSQVAA